MEAKGGTVAAIARAFAVTEAHVYRRLALAHLPDPVLDALAAGEISLSNAASFTVGNDEKVTMEVLETVRGEGYSDHQIKQMLKPDSVRGSDRRVIYVTEATYDATLERLVQEAGDARAALRLFHLSAHLLTLPLLTEDQVRQYSILRGYSADPCASVPQGHDPAMWRKHNGCD